MFKFNRKIHKSVRDDSVVEVSEVSGVRSLHLGTVTIQSSMKVKDPFALELADFGLYDAARRDSALAKGINVLNGTITYAAVARAFGLSSASWDTVA